MPPAIYTSVKHPIKADAHGMGENRRVHVTQVVHDAPKGIKDRKAILILSTEESLMLGADLIGSLPMMFLHDAPHQDDRERWLKELVRLGKFIAVLTNDVHSNMLKQK